MYELSTQSIKCFVFLVQLNSFSSLVVFVHMCSNLVQMWTVLFQDLYTGHTITDTEIEHYGGTAGHYLVMEANCQLNIQTTVTGHRESELGQKVKAISLKVSRQR